MSRVAAITVNRPRETVEDLWRTSASRSEYVDRSTARVTFTDAPGGRGTEIRVYLARSAPSGKVGDLLERLLGVRKRAKAMDELRRFKQRVETRVVARSDATPEGELAARKLRQRPARPLSEDEGRKAGVS